MLPSVPSGPLARLGRFIRHHDPNAAPATPPAHPCPVCRTNEDRARDPDDSERSSAVCASCGVSVCGSCVHALVSSGGSACPACDVTFAVPASVTFARFHSLVHDRAPGRHTPWAQTMLGNLHVSGAGTERDFAKAAGYYQLAAAAGDDSAMNRLALCHRGGSGVDGADHSAAIRWLHLAAAHGNPEAQLNLGQAHLFGEGDLTQDVVAAAAWLQLAADQAQAEAAELLEELYASGRLSPQHEALHTAQFEALQDAVARDDPAAMLALGDIKCAFALDERFACVASVAGDAPFDDAADLYQAAFSVGYAPGIHAILNLVSSGVDFVTPKWQEAVAIMAFSELRDSASPPSPAPAAAGPPSAPPPRRRRGARLASHRRTVKPYRKAVRPMASLGPAADREAGLG